MPDRRRMRRKGLPLMMTVPEWAETLTANIERVIYGKRPVIEKIIVALLARGHVLLEDVPGVGKTILARALSTSLGGLYRRIQCTPDLLPADVLGVSVYNPKTSAFDFHEGPVMTNVLLVDEINRATPRTQSALLEAMGDAKVSVEGRTIALPRPFILLATENPVEFEGTFPLPEAQKDRFFLSLRMGYPTPEAEEEVMAAQNRIEHPVTRLEPVTDPRTLCAMQDQVLSVPVAQSIMDYILALVEETRRDARLSLGASPRASVALYKGCQALALLRRRAEATAGDVRSLAPAVLLKRINVKPDHQLKGITEERVIEDILDRIPMPETAEAPGIAGGPKPRAPGDRGA
jgi:MoxR-like ATPase